MSKIGKAFRNAVLIKEVQTKSKRPLLSVWIMILNIVLGLAALITMIALNTDIVNNYGYDSNTFVTFFTVIVIIEAVLLFFVTPAMTSGAISSEKERQTLDVLLTTAMTPWQIIWGKYWSSIANILVLLVSTLPFMSIVFLFGGVSFFRVIGTLIALILSVMYLGTFGVLTSSAFKKSNAAAVICYILLMAVTFGSISLVASITAISNGINEAIWQANPTMVGQYIIKPDWSLVFLLFSPATVAYDVLTRGFGMDIFFGNSGQGMGFFIHAITDGRLSYNCFLDRYWVVIALAVQLFAGYWILKLAAASLNPVKRRKKNVRSTGVKASTVAVPANAVVTDREEVAVEKDEDGTKQ